MCLYIWLHFVYDRIFFLFLELFQSQKQKENNFKMRRCACKSRQCQGRLGGVVPGNACKAMFLTVGIQIDSCPFRSTQRRYCAFDSAVVLLLTQNPLRFPVLAGERSEHPETPLLPSTLGLLSSLSAQVWSSGSGRVLSAAARGAQDSDFSAALPSRTGPLHANHWPLGHNDHNEH